MAVVAEEPGIVVASLHVIGGEIEAVSDVFPIRYEGSDIVIHGQVGVPVDVLSKPAQVPPASVSGILEIPEVEGFRRGHDEEVADARVVPDVPVRGPGEENPIVPPCPCIVVLVGRGREHHSHVPVRVDVENGDEGRLGHSVVDPCPLTPLEDRFSSPVQPDTGLNRVGFVVLRRHSRRGRSETHQADGGKNEQ
jgi:hypothetical protein